MAERETLARIMCQGNPYRVATHRATRRRLWRLGCGWSRVAARRSDRAPSASLSAFQGTVSRRQRDATPLDYSGAFKRHCPLIASNTPMRREMSETDAMATCVAAALAADFASEIVTSSRTSSRVTRSLRLSMSRSILSIALPCLTSRLSKRSTLRSNSTMLERANALLDAKTSKNALYPLLRLS